jgi:hypothetical protein
MFFEKKSTKIISAALTAALIIALIPGSAAEEPFISYGYDWWGDTYPIQAGYVVERVIDSNTLNLSPPLRNPEDVFIYDETGEVFIVDTKNNRIVITCRNFERVRILERFHFRQDYLIENFIFPDEHGNVTEETEAAYWEHVERIRNPQEKDITLNNPTGIHVTNFQGETRIYIADHFNERVIACDTNGGIWMEYFRPDSDSFTDENGTPLSYRPSKVLTDNAGNVYVCLATITKGAVVFSEAGVFRGFFGSNRVSRGFDAMLNYVLRFVLTRQQMQDRTRAVPVEFSNFTIDSEQFIYTVTTTRNANLDIVTKLNPAGDNIFAQQGYDGMVWGDFNAPFAYGKYYHSLIVDISVDNKGDIYLLDLESGKVFQYDKEGHLMFIFGGRGQQKGVFLQPAAIQTYDDRVFVLDSAKSSLTVFRLTEFGGLVTEAMGLFNRGLYEESLRPWEEVLKRDANYYMAYVGMGNAKLSIGEFEEALDYFYRHSWGGYSRAYKDFRIHYIRENFDMLLGIAVIAVGLMIGGAVAVKILKKRKTKAETA